MNYTDKDLMNNFFQEYKKDKSSRLYDELAPLYNYVYSIHYDYDKQRDLVVGNAPDNTHSVLEGACGTGKLTYRLNQEYHDVVGFDLNYGMLEIARKNYPDIEFEKNNLTELDLNRKFDCYCVLGNALVHLIGSNDFKKFATDAFKKLYNNGRLIFDYMPNKHMVDGYSDTDIFETNNYKIDRDIITTKYDRNLYFISFSFNILDKNTNKEIIVGDTIRSRCYNKQNIKNTLLEVGFSNVNHKDYSDVGSSIKDGVIIADR